MRTRTIFVALAFFVAASTLAAPQTTAPHDPQLIDAQGYQKLRRAISREARPDHLLGDLVRTMPR